MDVVGIRDNRFTTAMGIIKGYAHKMEVRGKDPSMVSANDCEMLLTPDLNKKSEKTGVSKIFKGFIKNKEEKYE